MQIDATIIILPVTDLERSTAFYADGLGLPLVLDQGGCRIYEPTGSSYLGICERADSDSPNVTVTIVRSGEFGIQSCRAVGRRCPRQRPQSACATPPRLHSCIG